MKKALLIGALLLALVFVGTYGYNKLYLPWKYSAKQAEKYMRERLIPEAEKDYPHGYKITIEMPSYEKFENARALMGGGEGCLDEYQENPDRYPYFYPIHYLITSEEGGKEVTSGWKVIFYQRGRGGWQEEY